MVLAVVRTCVATYVLLGKPGLSDDQKRVHIPMKYKPESSPWYSSVRSKCLIETTYEAA